MKRMPAGQLTVSPPGAVSEVYEAFLSHTSSSSSLTSPFTQDFEHLLYGDVLRYSSASSYRKAPHHLCSYRTGSITVIILTWRLISMVKLIKLWKKTAFPLQAYMRYISFIFPPIFLSLLINCVK